ncbi:MAG: bifunctional phosphoribosylaminoimidazolecarboxamide formyltransferase/IMP cyclohydrolase [Sphaerochaetaceae bacterium]|nr:bifunctional phosphoribosylaminoimidazolecarboxamide formyltransferase/IMP cyclohydrolase [Sphaerochaetaceae bacterium]
MNTQPTTIKKALLSVSDKRGIVEFASKLVAADVEIISTGGTAKILQESGIPAIAVEAYTNSPEMMGGRVKTMHPAIMGGILGLRDRDSAEASIHSISWIDLVVCNLYPFEQTIKKQGITFDEAIEHIDIGGPTMIRAAAKNLGWACVITDISDYDRIALELSTNKCISYETRVCLATKAFAHTAAYDSLIQDYLLPKDSFPKELSLTFKLHVDSRITVDSQDRLLRYGENPHQKAAAYKAIRAPGKGSSFSLLDCNVLQGKQLSFNNLGDAQKAIEAVSEFTSPACVAIKHAIPCGVAIGTTIFDAVRSAIEADSLSVFGGIAALNKPCDGQIASYLSKKFLEVVSAPVFDDEALEIFRYKKNVRLIETGPLSLSESTLAGKFFGDDLLLQQRDVLTISKENLTIATKKKPTQQEIEQLLFAWKVVRHVRSNAIVVANERSTLGIGSGQVSRVDAVKIAIGKAKGKGPAVLASDAFFPFRDNIDLLKDSEISAIIQPGGSVRDAEVIQACDELGLAMVFTGNRCFSHS